MLEAIVAVYEDWGIGAGGSQPVSLSADRKFFRATTVGACVIVGSRTLGDFPGGRLLPGRTHLVLTRKGTAPEGAHAVASPEEAAKLAAQYPKAFVIGGGQVYRAMLPYCGRCIVTKIHAAPESDTFFENLDTNPDWRLAKVLGSGEENGIRYEFCEYERCPGTLPGVRGGDL